MGALLSILGCLFVTLLVVVKLTEKHGKPLEAEQQQRLSKIIMVLIAVMLVTALIKFSLGA